ncbi:ribonuclease P protein component [Helicobacter mesocricetorum]|uniref:ribonuclease P protein component n=1 Tax=Helicobacter mesocricetorum TaxID=87012 RepID=UPI000CF0A293|nr:ribonuclease P protein component [Helicobacter mesocricetorum]
MITLKIRTEFENVYKSQKRWHNPYFILFFKENIHPQKRIGFCVSKKVGNAVCRNSIKRRFRNIYKESIPKLKNGDMILLAKNGADKISYQTLKNNYNYALSRLHLMEKSG